MQADFSGQDINLVLDNEDSQSPNQIKTFEDWWNESSDYFHGDVDTTKDIARWAWEHIESLKNKEIEELKNDAARFAFISECERCVASGKWSIQVIDKSGKYTSKYFAKPPIGEPDVIYETRLDALRAAIDESMKGNNNE